MTREGANRLKVSLPWIWLMWFLLHGFALGEPADELRAVIIRAAGPRPGEKPAQVADAVTEATPQAVNTYVFSAELSEALKSLNAQTRIVDFSQCRNLECLLSKPERGNTSRLDIVVFAGPSHFSRLPKQLQSLYGKLAFVASASPALVCSSLVAAWYPDTKGVETAKHVEHAAKEAGLRTVTGLSLLTPRNDTPGVSAKAMKEALAAFSAQLTEKARAPMPRMEN